MEKAHVFVMYFFLALGSCALIALEKGQVELAEHLDMTNRALKATTAKLDELQRQVTQNTLLRESDATRLHDLQQPLLNLRLTTNKLETQVNNLLGWQQAQVIQAQVIQPK